MLNAELIVVDDATGYIQIPRVGVKLIIQKSGKPARTNDAVIGEHNHASLNGDVRFFLSKILGILTCPREGIFKGMTVGWLEGTCNVKRDSGAKVFYNELVIDRKHSFLPINSKTFEHRWWVNTYPSAFIESYRFICEINSGLCGSSASAGNPVTLFHLIKLPTHRIELAVVDYQRSNTDHSQSDLTPHRSFFNPVNLPRKFLGFLLALIQFPLPSFLTLLCSTEGGRGVKVGD